MYWVYTLEKVNVQLYATLQVKAFAWSPFGIQLFWFREAFLQIKLPAAKF